MGRLRGCLWLTAGLVVAVLAGAVAFITLQRAAIQPAGEDDGTRMDVVVAASTIAVRDQLTADVLEVRQLPADAVPEGAVTTLEEAEGKITMVDLYPGEVILAQRLVDPNVITGDGRYALVVAEEEVLMAFPIQDLMSRIGVLKPGDHVDLLFTLAFPVGGGLTAEGEGEAAAGQEEPVTFNLLQNLTIAAIVREQQGDARGNPVALLFTIDPQDALILKHVKDRGGILDIVLRPPGVEGPYDTEPVDVDYLINLYRIPTQGGR